MEEEKDQKELFEFEPPKKAFPVFGGIFRKASLENKFALTITLEKLVFSAIGVIMLMVIVYALGVEAGRSDRRTEKPYPAEAPVVMTPRTVQKMVQVAPAKPEAPASVSKVPALQLAQPVMQDAAKPYTIAVGSFKSKESAQRVLESFKKQGFSSFLKQGGSLYIVCVGAYSDMTSMQSKKALARMRQVRSDAYFITK